MSTYLDAGGAVKQWVNGLTATLVGAGNPLQLGVSLKQRDGAATVPYGYLVEMPAQLWGGAEHPSMAASIQLQVYGPTKESASDAALAYCEALIPLVTGARVNLPSGVSILAVDNVQGPQWFPDGDEPRYIVDCDFYFM
jgi:hypothetical protein